MALDILFSIFAVVALLSGLFVITARNPVKAVLSLIVCFVATAGSWMLLQAEFLSLVLIVVYVGAVMVLFLFVVMMLDVEQAEKKASFVRYWPFAGALGILLFCLLIDLIAHIQLPALTLDWNFSQSNVAIVGFNLFTQDLYPFEIAALILLAAMIAAISLTFRGRNPSTRSQKIHEQVRVKAHDRLRLVDIQKTKESAEEGKVSVQNIEMQEEKP